MSVLNKSDELIRNRKIINKLQQNGYSAKYQEKENEDDSQIAEIIKFRSANASTYHLTRIVILRFLAFIYGNHDLVKKN